MKNLQKNISNSIIPVKNTDSTIEGAECDFDTMLLEAITKIGF